MLWRRQKNFYKLSTFLKIKLDTNKATLIFVPHSWISNIKHA